MAPKSGTWEITLGEDGETLSVKLDGEEIKETPEKNLPDRIRPGGINLGRIYSYGNGICFKRRCKWF